MEVDVSKWSWDAAEVVEVAEYLDGVGVAIAVPAQMGRSKSNPCLDGFRLTREVAQVDPCFREQVLTSCSGNVLHSIRHAYIKFRFNSSKKTNKKKQKKTRSPMLQSIHFFNMKILRWLDYADVCRLLPVHPRRQTRLTLTLTRTGSERFIPQS